MDINELYPSESWELIVSPVRGREGEFRVFACKDHTETIEDVTHTLGDILCLDDHGAIPWLDSIEDLRAYLESELNRIVEKEAT